MNGWALGLGVGLVVLGVGYWLLVLTEGTYLGPRIVALLYDWFAGRYDRVKDRQFVYEAYFVGVPIAEALRHVPHPRALDVATGTGRVPLALLRSGDQWGTIAGLDRSRRMLGEAQAALRGYERRVALFLGDAEALPFADRSFDSVSCLEALEFVMRPRAALREMVRVLRPGGVLLLTNRVGPDAWFYPGRVCGRGHLEYALQALGLEQVETRRWQVAYDLVWARKPPSEGKGDLAAETQRTQVRTGK